MANCGKFQGLTVNTRKVHSPSSISCALVVTLFTARVAGSLDEELHAAAGYAVSDFGAVGNALAFGAGATGGRAHSAAAAGADAEFENAWHQRTAQIRGMVENNS